MIKIKRKIIKENEQTLDQAATQINLRKFAGTLSNSEAVIQALASDLKSLSGDNRYKATAWLLSQVGVKDTELSSVASKLKDLLSATTQTQTTQTQTLTTAPAAPAPAGAQGAPTK